MTSTSLCTLLQAVLLAVVAVASGVHGRVLHNPAATSELQHGLHMDSLAIEDSASRSAEVQERIGGAGRALQRWGWRRHWSHHNNRNSAYDSDSDEDDSGSSYARAHATSFASGSNPYARAHTTATVDESGNSVTSTSTGYAIAISH